MIVFLTVVAFFVASCGIDTRSDAEKAPDIGGIKLVRYLPVSVDAGIADMESRGYKVKQITDAPNTLFQSSAITVMYERVK